MTAESDKAPSPEQPTPSPEDTQLNQHWMEEEEDIVRTEIPERKRSGFDRVAFVAELKKNTPQENGKFMMGISKSKQNAEFGKHSRSRQIARAAAKKPREQAPLPRTQIRGIHHGAPLKVYIGAWITALFYASILLFFIEAVMVGLTFSVGIETIFILAFLLIMTVLFLMGARSCRCGICKSPFFSSGKLHTHKQAHQAPLFGKNLPTALHTIFLFWLRCPACGTPTRLIAKKDKKD